MIAEGTLAKINHSVSIIAIMVPTQSPTPSHDHHRAQLVSNGQARLEVDSKLRIEAKMFPFTSWERFESHPQRLSDVVFLQLQQLLTDVPPKKG